MKKLLQILTAGMLFVFLVGIFSLHAARYPVTNTNDTGAGSLRQAITNANNNMGPDTITFLIAGTGPFTIRPLSALPQINDRTGGLLIDGFTQPGAAPGANPPATATLLVEVNGALAGASHGFFIISPDNELRGLVVDSFQQDGIRIEGTLLGTFNNRVINCFVGTNPAGTTAMGNGWNQLRLWSGISITVPVPCAGPFRCHDNLVEGCLVSGNYVEGVGISSCPPGDVFMNHVRESYIGTDISGNNALGNIHDGVYIGEGAHDNLVDSCLISANGYEGVCIIGFYTWDPPNPPLIIFSDRNFVLNNRIGVMANGTGVLGNLRDGISIGQYGPASNPLSQQGHARQNVADRNIIANNQRNGIQVWENPVSPMNCDRNFFTENSIYNNSLLGIDLGNNGVTFNDLNDPDMGANDELNFPVINTFLYCNGSASFSGTLNIPGPLTGTERIEIFVARPDPTGYGEGEIYMGFTGTDAMGNWSVNLPGFSGGEVVTATATDANQNTSEFCLNVTLPPAVVIAETHTDPLCTGDMNGAINVTVSSGVPPYSYMWSSGQTTASISGVPAGMYTLNITEGNGCVTMLNVSLTDPPALGGSTVVTDATCSGCTDGAIDFSPTGGTAPYTFSWDNGAGTEDISNVGAGVYCVTVTDANNCVFSACDTVNEPGTGIQDLFELPVTVYPNPVNGGLLVVDFGSAPIQDAEITIYDLEGRKIATWSGLRGEKVELSLDGMNGGVYLLYIQTEEAFAQRKIVKLK